MTKYKSQRIDKKSLVHQSYDLIYETSISPTIVDRKSKEPLYRTIPAGNVILRTPLSRGYGSFPLQFTPVNSRFPSRWPFPMISYISLGDIAARRSCL